MAAFSRLLCAVLVLKFRLYFLGQIGRMRVISMYGGTFFLVDLITSIPPEAVLPMVVVVLSSAV